MTMSSRNKILPFLCGFASLLFASCASSPVGGNALPLQFSTLSVEEKSVLECDPKKPELSISVDLRYATDLENPTVSLEINHEILETALSSYEEKVSFSKNADFEKTVRDYVAKEVKSYQETWTEIFNDWGHSSGAENMIAIRGNTRGFVENAIIYGLEIDRDMGGAHPIHLKYFLNFDATTGKRLSLADIFKPEYEKELTELLTRKAMVLENVTTKSRLSCEPRPTENFVIEGDGILFYFNPYDIAPYSRGPISLKLRYTELARLLKKSASAQ